MMTEAAFLAEDFHQIGGPKRVVVNFSPCVVEHSPATKHLARQKVLRDDFVLRGREDDFVRSSYEDGPLVGMLRGKNPFKKTLTYFPKNA